jgi:hypothetical protein
VAEDLSRTWTARQPSSLGRFLLTLDERLRERHAVFEYTSDPRCILRMQVVSLEHDICLRDGTSAGVGERMIDLHLWTEQIPSMPDQGASIGWARRMNAGMVIALRELAQFLRQRPDLDDILVLRARTPFTGPQGIAQSVRLMGGYGFEAVAEPALLSLRDRVHRLGENMLITLMVLAHNPPALRGDTLLRERALLFMSRATLERRYLTSPTASSSRPYR